MCINIVADRSKADQQIQIIPIYWCLYICDILSFGCRDTQNWWDKSYVSYNLILAD